MIRQDGLIAGAEGVEQAGGALDVGEHQGDGSPGQLSHVPSLSCDPTMLRVHAPRCFRSAGFSEDRSLKCTRRVDAAGYYLVLAAAGRNRHIHSKGVARVARPRSRRFDIKPADREGGCVGVDRLWRLTSTLAPQSSPIDGGTATRKLAVDGRPKYSNRQGASEHADFKILLRVGAGHPPLLSLDSSDSTVRPLRTLRRWRCAASRIE